jgi:hypothetical protein
MDDSLVTMFWGGFATGAAITMGACGLTAALWRFRPARDRHISDVDESRYDTSESTLEPLPRWDNTDV